jgi:O-antigen/teichoic acid export membrane protein
VWTLIATGTELESCLLSALNRVRLQAVVALIATPLNVVLSIYGVRRIGSVGVVLGTVVSYLLVVVIPLSMTVAKELYGPLRDCGKDVLDLG